MSNVGFNENAVNLMDDTVEMVRSNKGGAKIIHRGYMYTVHKRRIGGIRWRCARRILHCKGSITTSNSAPPVINLPHNHVPDLHAVAIARSRSYPEGEQCSPETLMGLQLGPTAKILPCVAPFDNPYENSSGFIPVENIKEEYFDEKPISNSCSPSPSTSSIKSNLKTTSGNNNKTTQAKTAPVRNTKSPSSVSSAAEEAEVCLRWNSHHANMQTSFPTLMDKEQFVDVTLAAEGKIIKCHKLILSSCSSYFDDMLKSTQPNQHPIIFLPKMEFWIIKSLVEFMYKGEVNVDQTKLQTLIQAAEELQIKGLAKQSSVKNEYDENIQSENEETMNIDEYLKPDSPDIPDNDEDEFKPYYYYKKNKKKPKKKKIPEPMHIKTVPCNLKGTKSRPNIKQPVFFDPDFPDHDPYRSITPVSVEKDPIIDIDDIKMEPVDIDVTNYYENQENAEKLPLIVEINQGKTNEYIEPAKKQTPEKQVKDIDKTSPITIEAIDSKVQLTLEKISPTEKNDSDVKKKFCIVVKSQNGTEKSEKNISEPPPLLKIKNFASEDSDMSFKRIKLTATESNLTKNENNDICDI